MNPWPKAFTFARLRPILFWVVIAGLSFAGLGRGLWTPDEPREAEIGREMLLHPGFVPHLNTKPFFEKPPLYYWALAGAYAVGGVSETSARAVSGAMGLATLLLIFGWARKDASREVAYMAVFILATCVQFFQSTHWVLLDPMLMFWVVLALWGAWSALSQGPRGASLAALYGGLCLAVWTKGLIGVALPAAGLLLFLLLRRKDALMGRLRPVLGAVFMTVFIGLCLWAFYVAEGRDALYQLVWVNHVERFIRPSTTGHAQPFYYYLHALLVAVLPWLLPFLALFRPSFWRRDTAEGPASLKTFLACVVGGGVLLLSLASTKRETYLLPLIPPLAMLMALALEEALRRGGAALDGADRWLFGRVQPLLLSLWGLAVPAALVVYTRSPRPAYVTLLAAGLLAGLTGIYFGLKARLPQAWDAHRVSAALMCAAALAAAVPVAEAQKNMAPFCRWAGVAVPGRGPIPALGADETLCGIIPFTTGRWIESLTAAQWAGRISSGDTPPYLLEQSGAGRGDEGMSRAGYSVLGERQFGPGRTLRLWRLTKQTERAPP